MASVQQASCQRQLIDECQDPNDRDPSTGLTALQQAALDGDSSEVGRLVRSLADVDAAARDGSTALHLAVRRGRAKVAQLLVRSGADVNARTQSGVRPLHEAALRDRPDVVQLLVEAGAATDFPLREEPSSGSPLFVAAAHGCARAAAALMEAGADVNFCISHSEVQTLEAFIAMEAWPTQRTGDVRKHFRLPGLPVIRAAAMSSGRELVRQLVHRMADVDRADDYGVTAIETATSLGKADVVAALIAGQASLDVQDTDGWSPLHYAAHSGYSEIAEMLVKAGADVNLPRSASKRLPLHYAAQNGHAKIAHLLLSARAHVDPRTDIGWSPLHLAAMNGHARVALQLLAAGAQVDLADVDGFSPIHMAAQHGYTQVVSLLATSGAEIDLRENAGGSAMHTAANHGHAEVVSLLLRAGAELDLRENIGWTALHLVAQLGFADVAETLVRFGCQVDISEYDGWTPLHVASQNGHAGVAATLLDSAADVALVDRFGWSAVHFAAAFGEFDILQALLYPKGGRHKPPVHSSNSHSQQDSFDSVALSTAMSKAGFNCTAASVQGGIGSVLQDIVRKKFGSSNYFVFGSFADGWGSSLSAIDGQIDADSDIDITRIQDRPRLHVSGPSVRCSGDCVPAQYHDGHVSFPVNVTRPNQVSKGSILCPALDEITAYPCCGYPAVLMAQPGHASHMSPAVLGDLGAKLRTTLCHAVSAAPPGLEGARMRVSTTHLELAVMRSLSTLQGQLFILLKFLIKKVIAKRVTGLKTYHAKNLLFFMLEEAPADQWQPENLLALARRALQMLLRCLSEVTSNQRECMMHFFLRDASVYLRSDHQPKSKIHKAVSDVINELPELLLGFSKSLRQQDNIVMQFHPFLVVSSTSDDKWHPSSRQCQYHEIYVAVEQVLLDLSDHVPVPQRSKHFRKLLQSIDRIPDCGRTARECLRALAHLKYDRPLRWGAALTSTVCQGIPCPDSGARLSPGEARKLVWDHMDSADSAWKFCFMWNERPNFEFLPSHIRDAFPCAAWAYTNYFYVNFDALMKTLQLEFGDCRTSASAVWEELASAKQADPQELLMALHYCRDDEALVRIVHQHRGSISIARLTDEVLAEYKSRLGMLQVCERLVAEKAKVEVKMQHLHVHLP